jgi:glycosyltransferase involved in cell wall biosynthesis
LPKTESICSLITSIPHSLAIARRLRSAAFAGKIVVVDNGSTDKTVEIARALSAKVIEAPDRPGFERRKNYALEAAT